MKVVILAGGKGSRLGPETARIPKPMIRIGGHPILWHIIHSIAQFGFDDFLIAAGYRGNVIADFFSNSINSRSKEIDSREPDSAPLAIRVLETGVQTRTGGRVLRTASRIGENRFLLSWGDGLHDIDLGKLVQFHDSHGRLATLTAVHPPARFGQLTLDGNRVLKFTEKPNRGDEWISGGVFVLQPGVFDFIENDQSSWEYDVLPRLAAGQQLMAFRHEGFWQCMDNPAEREYLDALCQHGDVPWLGATRRLADSRDAGGSQRCVSW